MTANLHSNLVGVALLPGVAALDSLVGHMGHFAFPKTQMSHMNGDAIGYHTPTLVVTIVDGV